MEVTTNKEEKEMKKKLGISIGAVAGAMVLGLGIYHSDASQANPELSTDEIRQTVTDQYPGTITEMELEKNSNKVVYEVEVENEGKEYDIKLDGKTGEVLDLKEKEISNKESDAENDDDADDRDDSQDNTEGNGNDNQNNTSNNENQNTVIDLKKAEEIALKEFDGKITGLELDEDDGRQMYEIEMEKGEDEAEMEIDAYTGEILVIEIDREED